MLSRFWLIFALLTTWWGVFPHHTLVQQQPVVFDHASVEFHYGKDIYFSIDVDAPFCCGATPQQNGVTSQQISGVMDLTIHSRTTTLVKPVSWSAGTNTYPLDLKGINLPAFSHIVYSYRLVTDNGETYKSPDYTFFYIDNRFTWRTIEQNQFRLHWYEDNDALQQNLIKISEDGITSASRYFSTHSATPLDIYLYADPLALRQVLNQTNNSLIIAHAIPEENSILVTSASALASALPQLERQIPHEITHVLQYQSLGKAYTNLPTWFSEGTASLAETYPDPDANVLFQQAVHNSKLIPMTDLCLSFPSQGDQARLAYVQSAQFVTYLQGSYGYSGLKKLASAYQNGLDCSHGFSSVLGLSIEQAEANWKKEGLHLSAVPDVPLENSSPYLLLGFLIILSTLLSLWFFKK
jgi:hypothetical protein